MRSADRSATVVAPQVANRTGGDPWSIAGHRGANGRSLLLIRPNHILIISLSLSHPLLIALFVKSCTSPPIPCNDLVSVCFYTYIFDTTPRERENTPGTALMAKMCRIWQTRL
jgi:hypothetical protein